MMKKTLVAIAALAAASGAFAQTATANAGGASSVTIFGVADVSVSTSTADGAIGTFTGIVGSGNNASSRLGFRGVEDLGGGMAAAFWLEAGVNIDSGTGSNTTTNNTNLANTIQLNQTSASSATSAGTLNGRQGLTFNRASTVSLISKGFGEIRLGRDYTPTFWSMTQYDPFGTVGVGAATNVIVGALNPMGAANTSAGANYPSVRTSNSIGWLSNDMSGFRAQLQYALSEVPSGCGAASSGAAITGNNCNGQSGDGAIFGARLAYAGGPLAAALAWSQTTYGAYSSYGGATVTTSAAAVTPTVYSGNYTQVNVAGSYNFGSFRLMGQYNIQQREIGLTTPSRKLTASMIGVTVPVGATTFKASYGYGSRADGNINANGGAVAATDDGASTNQLAIGFQNDLSRRTALYGTYSIVTLNAGATTGGALNPGVGLITGDALAANSSGKATGIDLGIRHSF